MGRRAGGKDFSPRVRSIFDHTIEECLKDGSLYKKLKEQLLADPAGTFRAMAAYAPKQVDMSVDQTLSVDTTQLSKEALEAMFTEKEKRESGSDQQVH